MAEIICYGGVNEIGGNRILLRDSGTEVFLDFGRNFSRERMYYDPPYLEARCTEHLLGLGILPDIPGIYRGIDSGDGGMPAGVLITHPHTDHYDYIRFLREEIPIHCGEITREIITARECAGGKWPSKEYYICNLTKTEGYREFRKFETFTGNGRGNAGGIRYRAHEVDHSTYGAYGFILETGDGVIAYTGDLRLHGKRSGLTRGFIDALKKEDVELLIIEGTNIDSHRIATEDEVRMKIREIVNATGGMVLCGFSLLDFERFLSFYEAAKEAGRKFVISMKQAYILSRIYACLSLPSPADENIYVLAKEKKRGDTWEDVVMSIPGVNLITAEEISTRQEGVLMVAGFYDFNELITIKPVPGSVYILAQSEPFNEEMEIDHEKMKNWLDLYGLPMYTIHASGHASPHELKSIISGVNPGRVLFIHTERPHLYQRFISDLGIESIIPVEGQPVSIRRGSR